jgi:hypothetical protein
LNPDFSRILPVVEGKGDLEAVPVLLRRTLDDMSRRDVRVIRPHERGEWPRVRRRFEQFFSVAVSEGAPVLWVLDFDCDDCTCVASVAAEMYERARQVRAGWPFRAAFMVKEYESLFLAEQRAAQQVLTALPDGLMFPDDPEAVRPAKEWLSRNMPKGSAYKPSVHQAPITARLDLTRLEEASPSYRHLKRSVERLLHWS